VKAWQDVLAKLSVWVLKKSSEFRWTQRYQFDDRTVRRDLIAYEQEQDQKLSDLLKFMTRGRVIVDETSE
jgi:hypothetical protein